ncbi:MAG: helix-turn-helix domain-containing protein, partial [Pseudomonadota bacterium]
ALDLLEGGPIAEAEDLSFVSQNAEIDGYVGGSTFDRVPIETSIGDHIAGYRLAMDAVVKPRTQDRKLISAAAACGLVGESGVFYAALEAVRRAAHSNAHLVIIVPPGGPRSAILNLLEKLGPKPKRGGFIELGQDGPDRADLLELIFGRADAATSKELLRRENAHLVVHGFDTLSPPVQNRLLRLTQTGAYTQSGSSVRRVPRARMVLMVEQAEAMQLPQDSEYVMQLRYPDLASRSEEIAKILAAMFEKMGAQPGLVSKLSPAVMQRLRAHLWHGNEDELRRIARDCLAVIPAGGVTLEFLENRLSAAPADMSPNRSITPKQQLVETLARHNFRRTDTARALNISRKTLYNRMKKFDLL